MTEGKDLKASEEVGFHERMKDLPPEAEMLPRNGTRGIMLFVRSWLIFSISSTLTPE